MFGPKSKLLAYFINVTHRNVAIYLSINFQVYVIVEKVVSLYVGTFSALMQTMIAGARC